jgi:RecJ-like exonuclease
MKIFKLNYLILSFFFIVSCGYQPLYSNKTTNFYIYKINSFGNEKVNKALINRLEIYKDKNSNKKIELEINSKINKTTTSKDTKGNPKTFRIEIILQIKVIKDEKINLDKIFSKSTNYNNSSKKFELKKYEENLKINLIDKISEDIIGYLQTL